MASGHSDIRRMFPYVEFKISRACLQVKQLNLSHCKTIDSTRYAVTHLYGKHFLFTDIFKEAEFVLVVEDVKSDKNLIRDIFIFYAIQFCVSSALVYLANILFTNVKYQHVRLL